MRLLSSQKNEIFDLLLKRGFHFSEFNLVEGTTDSFELPYTKILYKRNNSYYFRITEAFPSNRISYSPSSYSIDGNSTVNGYADVIVKVEKWVEYLKREIQADNIWQKRMEEIRNEGISLDSSNKDSFTPQEKETIKNKVNALKQEIASLKLLGSEEIKVIDGKLDNLNDKLDKLDKSSWIIFCAGTFFTIMSALSLSPEVGRTLWHIFLEFMSTQLKLI